MNRTERDFFDIFGVENGAEYNRVMADIELDDMLYELYHDDNFDVAEEMLASIGIKCN